MEARLSLGHDGILVGEDLVDPCVPEATERLVELLGPPWKHSDAGFHRGREATWLGSGVVLVTGKKERQLVSLFVCFDALNSSPYPDIAAEVPIFKGTLNLMGYALVGGEVESDVLGIPSVGGFGGMLRGDFGRMHIGFDLRAPLGTVDGRRAKTLVQVVAEWSDQRQR